jgi:hypothetical protein
MKNALICVTLLLLLTQCASFYHPIDPPTVEYTSIQEEEEDLGFSYQYDVLARRGNRKYSKKEKKHGFSILAVKVTNNTNRELNFARDIDLLIQRGTVYPAENEYTAHTIRQKIGFFLFYSLLTYSETDCNSSAGCKTTVFIPFGIAIAAASMIIGGSANAKMRKEFNDYSLYTKSIAPGETVYGIVALRDLGYQPLKLRLRGQ